MSTHDPILHAISLRFQRTVLFVVIFLALSIALWGWTMLGYFEQSWRDIWSMTLSAVSADEHHHAVALLLRGCGVIGLLATSLLYLLVAVWWKRSGDVHRRGARFIDDRDGRD